MGTAGGRERGEREIKKPEKMIILIIFFSMTKTTKVGRAGPPEEEKRRSDEQIDSRMQMGSRFRSTSISPNGGRSTLTPSAADGGSSEGREATGRH